MYLTELDYRTSIRDTRLMQMLERDLTMLAEVEPTAMAIVEDALCARYDTVKIWQQTGADRHAQVVRWMKCLCLYFLYERLPDRLIPPHIQAEYERTLATLSDLELGKKSSTLPLLAAGDTEQAPSRFRWGFAPRRSH